MNKFDEKLGVRIRQLRSQRKLSREKLVELSDISDRFIYDIENGKKGMSAETLYKFSKVFNVTSDYILFGVESEEDDLNSVVKALGRLSNEDRDSVKKIILEICSMLSKGE